MQRLSTNDVPKRERLAFVHDFVARHVIGMRFEPADKNNFRFDLGVLPMADNITIGRAQYTPLVGTRPRDLLGDGRDNYLLTIHTADHEISVEGKDAIQVRRGDIMIIDHGTWSQFRLSHTVVNVVSFGRPQIAKLVPRLAMEASYHIPQTAVGMPLMAGYADLLRKMPPQDERARQLAAAHLYDLVALVLDDFVKGGAGRNERSIGAVRVELMKRDVLDRLRDPELSIGSVAQRQGITPRYAQRLFESEGVTFSEFLRESRLALAFDLLRERTSGQVTIAAIAFDAGFCDLSAFNRAFRRRYGATPSEVRAEAMRSRAR